MSSIGAIGAVDTLWRYPVKSMLGEELGQAAVDVRGILGDRLYAVRDEDGKLGSGKDTRRFRKMDGLLRCRAGYLSDLTPAITLPDGQVVRGNDEDVHWALGTALGRPKVTLAKEGVISHFDEQPLHLVTTATIQWLADTVPQAQVDVRRLRPNVVIRTAELPHWPEDDWVGRELHIGSHLVIEITGRTERCAMVNLEQDGLPYAAEILRAVAAERDLYFGVHARVLAPGRIRVGDPVTLA